MIARARLTSVLTSGTALLLALMTWQPGSALAGGDIKDIIADLFGGDGITLDTGPDVPNHTAHFESDSGAALNDLSDVIAASASIFALPSASGSYTFDLEIGVPVRTTDSFGPILTERAQTIGQGKLNVGFFFSRTVYKQLEGDDLDDLSLTLNHLDCCGGPATPGVPDFELDVIITDIDLDLEQDVFSFFGTYGITNNWDIGLLLSAVYVDAEATATGTIINNRMDGVHVPGAEALVDSNDESSLGIGDTILRTKFNASDLVGSAESQWIPNLGALAQFTVPTGDEDDLQGLGDFAALGVLIASKQIGWAGPHLNVGFEVVPGNSDLNNLRYAGGLDIRVVPELTVVADVIGRWHPDGSGERDIVDLSLGARWDPLDLQSPVTVNFLIPINKDTGLRPDVTWSVGFNITF